MVIADRRPKAPEFPDQDTVTEGDQTDQELEVDENKPPTLTACVIKECHCAAGGINNLMWQWYRGEH